MLHFLSLFLMTAGLGAVMVPLWRGWREDDFARQLLAFEDASTGHKAGAKARGHGEGYAYPHDDPAGFGLSYLPEELKGRRYYRPAGAGEEPADGGTDR